jgi:hypothetical protein
MDAGAWFLYTIRFRFHIRQLVIKLRTQQETIVLAGLHLHTHCLLAQVSLVHRSSFRWKA